MSKNLFVEHGLDALHEWPEAQDAALARLEALREAALECKSEVAGVIAPPEKDESHS